MRFKSKSVLLALVAVFAMSAVTVAAASAATPEFKPMPAKKKLTSSGSVRWKFDNGAETVTCSKSAGAGEITGTKTVGKLVVKFTGCKSTGATKEGCAVKSTNTSNQGEIVTNALSGELGTVKTTEAASGAGLMLEPETGTVWTTIAKDECLKETKMTGTLAAEVATIGKKQVTNKLVIADPGDSQAIKRITLDSGKLAEPELELYSSTLVAESSDELMFEEAVEVT